MHPKASKILNEEVERTKHLSDQKPHEVELFARIFTETQFKYPGKFSLELGTREGGSALLMLRILNRLYDLPPILITVDPYGAKPYNTGNYGVLASDYGDTTYIKQKHHLAKFGNHIHLTTTGEYVLEHMADMPIWYESQNLTAKGNIGFFFHDAEHDSGSIARDIDLLLKKGWMREGIILVDNSDLDPKTVDLATKAIEDNKFTFTREVFETKVKFEVKKNDAL